jgi:hypothetical protein
MPATEATRSDGEFLGAFVRDCSNAQYECVRVGARVFAVPKAGLVVDSSFAIDGSELTVEQCVQLAGDHAQWH